MNPIRLTKNYLSYRRTVRALSDLPADRLEDIGLQRGQISAIASRAFR